jgi:putative endonuclease
MKNPLGEAGERYATDYLIKNGYKILDRNWRIRGGEIDIVALYKSTLVFVEVKTRTSTSYGTPEESIGYHKS